MPLIVKDDQSGIRVEVLAALEQICPGAGVQIDANGVVTKAASPDCDDYCTHPAGCNLLDAMITLPGTTTIEGAGFGSQYNPVPNSQPPEGTLYWMPTGRKSGANQCGRRETYPSVVLAHELIHAYQHRLGTLTGTMDAEFATVRSENQIRAEICELARVKYGDKSPVPNYDQGTLPEDDKEGCACDAPERWPSEAWRRITCLLRMALRCITDRLEAERWKQLPPSRLRHFAEDILPVDTPLEKKIKTALATRSVSAHSASIDGLAAKALVTSTYVLLLEAVELTGSYGAVLIYSTEEGMQLVTNLNFDPQSTDYVRGPGPLIEHALPPQPEFGRRLRAASFPGGIGGRNDVFGGMVQFLTVKAGQGRTDAAIYGYRYPAFDASSEPPQGDDGARWATVSEMYSIAQQFVLGPRIGTRLLAPRDAG